MFGQMQTAIAAVGVAAGRAFEAIGSQVRGIEEGVGRAIGGTLKGIGGGLKGIGSAQYGGNILSPLIEGARGAVNAAVKSVNHLAQGVIEGMRSIITGVTGLFGELAKTALMSVGGVIGAFTPVGPTYRRFNLTAFGPAPEPRPVTPKATRATAPKPPFCGHFHPGIGIF